MSSSQPTPAGAGPAAPGEPEVLYHCTTAAGLLGIVETGTLWATDADFLNDSKELRFGRPELHAALLRWADEISSPDDESGDPSASRATVMRSAAAHLAPDLGITPRHSAGYSEVTYAYRQYHFVYVACFCEKGDLLSQWRGYGAAGGYAVGFRSAALRRVQPEERDPPPADLCEQTAWLDEIVPPDEPRLVRVRYGDAAMEEAVRHVVDTIAPDPVGFPAARGYDRAQSVALPALAGVKHAAFEEEHEWRLVLVTDKRLQSFRTGPLGVIPYVEFLYPPEAIAEVVVGPGPERELRVRGAQRLVGEGVDVRPSDAPFRS